MFSLKFLCQFENHEIVKIFILTVSLENQMHKGFMEYFLK